MEREPSPYITLDVSETATPRQIKRAYRRLVRKYHPDTAATGEADEGRVILLTEMYEILSDPEQRREYDRGLNGEAGAHAGEAHSARAGQSPVGAAAEPLDPEEHISEEPLLPALAKLLWRLIRAGFRRLPFLFRTAPRVGLVGGLLIVAVIAGSWALRSYSKFSDEAEFEGTLPDSLTRHCRGRSGIGEHLPEGSSAALDCNVRGVSVTYFDTDDDYAGRYFVRHLRQARKQAALHKGKAGSCASPGHVAVYGYRGEYGATGRVFCWIDKDGEARFEWTDEDIYAQAASERPYRRMYRWWRKKAGPYGGIVNADVVAKVR
jgi:curved DNA-binding protein CbpA